MKTYKISPTGTNTFDSETLDSLQGFSINEAGENVTLGADGKPYIQASLVDNIAYNVTVTGSDTSIKPDIGTAGSLVLIAAERENGGSGVEAADITYTFAQAVLTDVSSNINHAGAADITYTFSCYSADGDTSPVAIS